MGQDKAQVSHSDQNGSSRRVAARDGPPPTVSGWSIAAIVLTALSVVYLIFFGSILVAIFTVGAGFMSLRRSTRRTDVNAILAYISLGASYAMAIYLLVGSAYFWTKIV